MGGNRVNQRQSRGATVPTDTPGQGEVTVRIIIPANNHHSRVAAGAHPKLDIGSLKAYIFAPYRLLVTGVIAQLGRRTEGQSKPQSNSY